MTYKVELSTRELSRVIEALSDSPHYPAGPSDLREHPEKAPYRALERRLVTLASTRPNSGT